YSFQFSSRACVSTTCRAAWMLCVLAQVAPSAYCQPPADDPDDARVPAAEVSESEADKLHPTAGAARKSSAYLQQQIADLSHRSYRARQLARWRLEQTPLETLQEIE